MENDDQQGRAATGKEARTSIPIGSTRESLGKIDFDHEVPLDREEEMVRKVDALETGVAERPGDRALDLLFTVRVGDLGPRPPVKVPAGSSVALACAAMRQAKSGSALVMDGPRLAGIFTERDVLYKLTGDGRRPEEVPVEELMSPNPTTLRPGHRLAHALNKMSVDGCRHLPVIDEAGQVVGVLSVRRIIDYLAERFPEKLLNLPPDPDQEMPRPEGG